MFINRNKLRQYIFSYPMSLCITITAILALIEKNLIILIHGPHLKELVAATYGVSIGRPHWREVQNKLLGPSLVKFISILTGWPFTMSFRLFFDLSLIITNLVAFYIFKDLTKNRIISLKYVFYLSVFFIVLQHWNWLYLWDLIDILLFLIFGYCIFKNLPLRYFVYLFIVSLLNKENALFISLWIIISSFKYDENSKNIRINYSWLFIGMLLMVLGVFYVKLIRDYLFVESMLPWVGLDLKHVTTGQHFVLIPNMMWFIKLNFIKFWKYNIIVALISIVCPLYLLIKMSFDELSIKLMILFLSMLFSIFLFGLIVETRVFFILIPFILLINLKFNNKIARN